MPMRASSLLPLDVKTESPPASPARLALAAAAPPSPLLTDAAAAGPRHHRLAKLVPLGSPSDGPRAPTEAKLVPLGSLSENPRAPMEAMMAPPTLPSTARPLPVMAESKTVASQLLPSAPTITRSSLPSMAAHPVPPAAACPPRSALRPSGACGGGGRAHLGSSMAAMRLDGDGGGGSGGQQPLVPIH